LRSPIGPRRAAAPVMPSTHSRSADAGTACALRSHEGRGFSRRSRPETDRDGRTGRTREGPGRARPCSRVRAGRRRGGMRARVVARGAFGMGGREVRVRGGLRERLRVDRHPERIGAGAPARGRRDARGLGNGCGGRPGVEAAAGACSDALSNSLPIAVRN
jgi:hypothetical protein